MYRFCAPSCSLDAFMKAEGVRLTKFYFPYEWLDDYTKLDAPTLPSKEAFWSSLKGGNTLGSTPEEIDAHYADCQTAWFREGMQTFRDFLEYYNVRDVAPFRDAIRHWLTHFHEKEHLDVLKECVGLAGIARKLLARSASQHPGFAGFSLTSKKFPQLEELVRSNLVGGPSIIFNRHHERDVTRIRDGLLPCRSLLGYDANSLYPYAMSLEMPTGAPFWWAPAVETENDPSGENPSMWEAAAGDLTRTLKPTDTAAYISHFQKAVVDSHARQGREIQHLWNTGREVRMGPYKVDGFLPAEGVVLEAQGCHWHGHDCERVPPSEEQETRLRNTYARARLIEEQTGFRVEMVWECEFAQTRAGKVHARRMAARARRLKEEKTEAELLDRVKDGTFYGALEVRAHVPEGKKAYFGEMAPFFVTTLLDPADAGPTMGAFLRERGLSTKPVKTLVGGMAVDHVLLSSHYVKWLLEKGVVVDAVHQALEWRPDTCLTSFVQGVAAERREASKDPSKAASAAKQKLIANSAYGGMLINKLRHCTITFENGTERARMKANDPLFRFSREVGDDLYEVETAKQVVKYDIPKQVGYFTLQHAKLRMLQFYYDGLDRFLTRDHFELCQMDTDSLYFAVSFDLAPEYVKFLDGGGSTGAWHPLLKTWHPWAEHVKPWQKTLFRTSLWGHCQDAWTPDMAKDFFPRQCCEKHFTHDQKTPGLFKLENVGVKMIGLCSKTYCLRLTTGREKFATKGVNKHLMRDVMPQMEHTLTTGDPGFAVNRGIKSLKEKVITYEQKKQALSYRYLKRKICPDHRRTEPLETVLTPCPAKRAKV